MKFSIVAWDLEWERRNFLSDLPEILTNLGFNFKTAAKLQARAIADSRPWQLRGLPYMGNDGNILVDQEMVVLA